MKPYACRCDFDFKLLEYAILVHIRTIYQPRDHKVLEYVMLWSKRLKVNEKRIFEQFEVT